MKGIKVTTKCTKHRKQRLTDTKVKQCEDCQQATIAVMLVKQNIPCTICGQAPGKQWVIYNGAKVWACGKIAHQASSKDRQEFKKFKKKVKQQEKIAALKKQQAYEQVTA